MAYEKTVWKDRVVEKPNTYRPVENPDGTITLYPVTGQIIEKGTPVSAANLNKIEDGIAKLNSDLDNIETEKADKINTYNKTEIYNKNEVDNKVFTMANMGQDIKEAITGGSVAVVGENVVDTINVRDKAITSMKRTPFGEMGMFVGTTPVNFIITTDETKMVFPDGTFDRLVTSVTNENVYYIIHRNIRYKVPKGTIIDLRIGSATIGYICLDTNTSTVDNPSIIVITNLNDFNENHILLAIYRTASPTVFATGNYVVNGKPLAYNYYKNLGDCCYLRLGLNIDTINNKITIPAQRLVCGKNTYDIKLTELALDISYSYPSLFFNTTSKTFNFKYSYSDIISDNDYLVASWYKQDYKKGFFSGKITIDNKELWEKEEIVSYNGLENTIYSWWVYPLVKRYKGIRDNTYIGYVDNEGNIGVISKNNKTNLYDRKILANYGADDHNAPSVNILDDGRIMVILSGHEKTDYNHLFISEKRENIKSFSETLLVLPSGYCKVSYQQVIKINNQYHLFFRCKDTTSNYYWGYRKSSDGVTWEDAKIIISGESTQIYCKFMKFNDTKIKFLVQSNASLDNTELRLGYIDLTNNNILDKDNNSVLGNVDNDYINFMNFGIVIDKLTNRWIRLFDFLEGEENVISYCQIDRNALGAPYTTHVTYLDDLNNPTTLTLPDQGRAFGPNYQNSVCFIDKNNIVMSRKLEDKWVIEKYTNSDKGEFSLSEVLSESCDLNVKLMRPIFNDGEIIWNRGEYLETSYKTYDTDIEVVHV